MSSEPSEVISCSVHEHIEEDQPAFTNSELILELESFVSSVM